MQEKRRGRIKVHPRGFGFVDLPREAAVAGDLDARAPSAFVTPPDLNAFLDGDEVAFDVVAADGGRLTATGLELVARGREEVFGTVVRHGNATFLHVDRLVANTDWPLEGAERHPDGTPALGTVRGTRLVLDRVVPAADVPIERLLVRHRIRSVFDPACLEVARSARPAGGARQDLRHLPTVTIDAASTRDIDDALAALPAGPDGSMRLFVSIADVGGALPAGGPLDQEARARGTSVYLAGRVVPMIPEAASESALSLVEGIDRETLTVELRLDHEGQVRSVDVYESVIRSAARLTYDAVADYLDAGDESRVPAGVRETLRWLRTAAARIAAARASRGGVSIFREEASITFDAGTLEPTAVEVRPVRSSHRLVERLMVAANEAVAAWLVDRGLPALFRVHDEPTGDQLLELEAFARTFGFEAGLGPRLTPRGLAAFEAQYADSTFGPALEAVVARTLGPARYAAAPSLHFGLAAPLYVHFTSPIRRYADLVVHRVIKRYLRGERGADPQAAGLSALADHLNARGKSAAKAESERTRALAARIFAGRVGERFPGTILEVRPFGLLVQLRGQGVVGSIALDQLGAGVRYDAARRELRGEGESAPAFALGATLAVEVIGASEEQARIDLRPARGAA